MAEVASAYVSLLPSAKGFGKKLDSQISSDVESSGKRAGTRWGGALKAGALGAAAGIGIAAAKILGDSISSASQAQQAVGGVESVFGKYADSVLKDSKRAAQGLGLSATAYNELITVSGAMLKNKGLEDFAAQSKNLITVGADLSAMFGGSTKEAVDALNAAMRGESDPIERYGISLNQTAVNAVLAANGQDKLTGAALAQAQAQARLTLIQQQSADAQGAFGRESNTLAGQQARLSAQWDNMKVTLGTNLLPILTRLAGFVNNTLLPAIGRFRPQFSAGNQAIRSMSGPLNSLKSIFTSVVSIITAVWRKFGPTIVKYARSSLANVLQVVRGVLQVVAGVFKTISAVIRGDWSGAWDGIKTIVSGAKNIVVGIVKQLWNILKTVFTVGAGLVKGIVTRLWDGIKTGVKNLASGMVGYGRDLISGFISGIRSMASSLISAIKSTITDKLPGFVKKALGIASPSKVFATLGRFTMEGFAKGITDNAKKPAEAAKKAAQKVLEGAKETLGEYKTLAADVAGSFAEDVFGAVGTAAEVDDEGKIVKPAVSAVQQFLSDIGKNVTEMQGAKDAIASMQAAGVNKAFLTALGKSGNAELTIGLAADPAALAQAQSLFAQQQTLSTDLGKTIATAEMRDELVGVRKDLQKIDGKLEKQADRIGRAVAEALNGVAGSAGRKGKK